MKYSYVLIGLLMGYLFFDLNPGNYNSITKKQFFEIVNWENVTINSVIINKDKDIANIDFNMLENRWFNNLDHQICNYNVSNQDINQYCYSKKNVIHKGLNVYIQLPNNHNFENELLKNNNTKDLDVVYIDNPKPNYLVEIFNKVIFYLIIFVVFRTILSYLTGALVEGVHQATDTGTPFRIIKPNDPKNPVMTKLSDIAGYKDTKDEVQEYIEYLKSREKYLKMNAKLPRGLLLVGKPGSGKTLLAKAMAGESGVSFIHCSGSDFNDRFIGMGSNRVGQLFKLARENSPSIIFIDEIDSIGASREGSSYGVSHEHNVTLNKLLVEMDGFSDNENILVIASTNRHKSLDSALTRSGRFDRKLVIDLPNISERQEIFRLYLGKIPLPYSKDKSNLDLILESFSLKLAKKTSGVSGADINNICNQAAILAVRDEIDHIEWNHLERAIDDIMIGIEKRSRMMSDKEKEIVAHHEAGHALMGYLLKDCSPPIKVSIIPRGVDALGFSQQEPEEKKLYNTDELFSKVSVLYGGRAAEDLIFSNVTTGASDDIERATDILYSMITTYGLSKSMPLLNYSKSRQTNVGIDKQNIIEKEMTLYASNIYEWTKNVLLSNKELVCKLAKSLLENEILLGEDITKLIDPESELLNSLKVLES
jgi:AFG3 family protein